MIKRKIRGSTRLLAGIFLTLALVGCAAPGSMTPETVNTTDETAVTSSTTTTEPSSDIVIETLATDPDGRPFQVLSIANSYLVDLNGDGTQEHLSIDLREEPESHDIDKHFILLLNGEIAGLLDTEPPTIVLTDLDQADGYLDLLLEWQGYLGYTSGFYFYDGQNMINRGIIEDSFLYWPGRNDEQSGNQPTGLDETKLPESGILIENNFGQYGYFSDDKWFYEQPWFIAPNGLFEKMPLEGYLPMACFDDATGARLPYLPVNLKIDLPLYVEPTAAQTIITAVAGETVHLTRTDNIQWVELQRPNGQRGWFRTDYRGGYTILIDGDEIAKEDVFMGINYN